MTKTHKIYSLVFVLWFSLVSIGSIIGFSLGRFFVKNFSDRYFGLSIFIFLIVIGLFIGLGQWIALNTRLRINWLWIPATSIGFTLGSLFFYFVIMFAGQSLYARHYMIYEWVWPIVTFMGAGISTSTLQWIILKRKLASSIRWSLVSGVGLAIGFVVDEVCSQYYFNSPIYLGIIFSIVFGLITGIYVEPLILRPEIDNS